MIFRVCGGQYGKMLDVVSCRSDVSRETTGLGEEDVYMKRVEL